MGTVTLALRREETFQRLVAVKRPHSCAESAKRMFLEEARVAGMITHANVVSVLDVGEDAQGPFLIMDYVEGPSLGALMKTLGSRHLPIQVGLDIARQIAAALHAAHTLRDAKGRPLALVHRDVSPDNVLLGFDGVARLSDFGIARAEGRSHEKTAEGVLKGKVGYMAPELLRFEEPSVQSDLFALGVVLFEMLAGRRLYGRSGRETREVARRILQDAPPDLGDLRADVPPEIDALLFDLLAKEPSARPASAQEVVERLDGAWTERLGFEGRLPLDALVAHHFAEWREQRAARIEAATRSLEEAGDPRSSSDAVRGGRLRWYGLGAAALALALVTGALLSGGGDAPRLDSPPQGAEPVAPPPAPPTPVRVADPEQAEEPEGGPDLAAPDERPPRRARPRPSMRRRTHAAMDGQPFGTWGWEP